MLSIRPATPADAPLLLQLIRELAAYERDPDAVVATEADLIRDGFGPEPRFRADLAEWDGEPCGFAFWFFNYSTWLGRPGLYLEDLFVRPPFRGRGIGKALLIQLAQRAVREGCGRFQWQVLDWNEPALRFYEALGAQRMGAWLTLRVEGDALERLAALGR
jgi:GNAT superfamily N-acetyltransferase